MEVGKQERDDKWHKADVLFRAAGTILIPLAIVSLGFFANHILQSQQETEAKIRLYSELMSQREKSESELRKDMFTSIINTYLGEKPSCLNERLLNLELLAYNFHESFNLKPLFVDAKQQIHNDILLLDQKTASRNEADKCGEDSKETLNTYLDNLYKIARNIATKQRSTLEQVGKKADWTIILASDNPDQVYSTEIFLKLNGAERKFKLTLIETDWQNKRIKVRLFIDPSMSPASHTQSSAQWMPTIIQEFWVGFFDFPIIDSVRLSSDERCAVVLTDLDEHASIAAITMIYFPGSYASLKEKPYYEDIMKNLVAR